MQFTDGEKRRARLIALAALNAVPLVGVVALDWSLVALLTVYWIELGVRLTFAGLEALFAERKPEYDANGFSWLVTGALSEKRGSIPIPGLPLSIQVANIPGIAITLVIGGLMWLFAGGVGVGGVGEATGATLQGAAATSAGLGIIGVTIGRAVEAGSYFVTAEYEDVSAHEPLRAALMSVVGLGSALFVGGGFVVAGAPASFVLAAVFAVKLLADIVDVYRDRLEAYDEQSAVELGFDREECPRWEPIDTELDSVPTTVRPNRVALLVDGIARGVRSPAALVPLGLLVVVGLLSAVTSGGWPVGLFVVLGSVLGGFFATLGIFDRLFRYLCMEYRIADAVVGSDRLFGPQWRLSREQLGDADRTRTVADRLFGTETVCLDVDDRPIRLPHISPDTAERLEQTAERLEQDATQAQDADRSTQNEVRNTQAEARK
ncbi:hypothetical protein C453_11226 [Haloferax elongans ATCC BAA-1513]|uniref:Uncharacterized protein n=1 Tax=Haloferax elongans ATCC BAA-1513 TaxID=1230453 RepID=M0HLK1_HALEO|nr:DUF6498-containing protein [Haloferax elongans]ELZ84582.1 hypothetical protein C453_11226 [Haloferax elongans ATCC BAA-1513]